MKRSWVVWAIAAVFGGIHAVAAQNTPPLAIRVHVADSSGVPITGAEISVMRGIAEVLSRGTTDIAGNQTLTIGRRGEDMVLVVRKIGYHRLDRFFNDSVHALELTVVLSPVVRTLAPVNVTAQEDPRHKSYFIDAEEIEKSPRLIVDAFDIVTKLKPDMIWGRSGTPDKIGQHGATSGSRGRSRSPAAAAAATVNAATKYGYCPPVENVWVNGSWLRDVPIDPVAVARRTGDGLLINATITSVLASIKPEHIAELEYHPCTDMGADKPPRSNNAIFVTLKDGIAYEPGVGSIVASVVPGAASRNAVGDRAFLNRLLGVFDEVSGAPLPGVNVIDIATGTFAQTTISGTVTLGFLPAGESQIRVHKDGYAVLTMSVVLSPKDTAGITVILTPVKPPPSP